MFDSQRLMFTLKKSFKFYSSLHTTYLRGISTGKIQVTALQHSGSLTRKNSRIALRKYFSVDHFAALHCLEDCVHQELLFL